MESQRCLCLLWALLACYLFTSSVANNSFDVGGKDGWVTTPSESYSNWAGRNRFQVNDSLGSDSVLLVTKDDYNSCTTKNPLKTMDSGSDVFQFDKSGPYFFISGNEENCRKGQKLIVAVLSSGPRRAPAPGSLTPALSPEAPSPVANGYPSPAPSKSPSPGAEPPTYSQGPSPVPVKSSPPSAYTPTLAPSPTSDAPTGPVPAKSPSMSANTPYLAPYPVSMAPTGAPGPSPAAMTPHISLVPSGSPESAPGSESSPSPSTMPPAPSQSAESPSPLESPSSSPPIPAESPSSSPPTPTPGSSIASTPSPNSNNGAGLAPAPPPAASWVATPSTVMVIVASFLVSSVIGVWP
ncbi:hypothetical protein SADUNF_Sadunf16G0262700 [Salix dunnii]|uniref:Phytocyanin domain-containing protein n=1 Tax=Salix dunnii TaxID=1413687 RepID=A0A835JAK1_9ROSI|nr:hypothetical protein SADUNF_Sadunf16G0262700 [Salix dunnii]